MTLNIDTRRKERDDEIAHDLALENERRKALNLEPINSLEELENEDRPDVQLDQAAGIVTDLAVMREVRAAPAQTAQVQP